MHVNGSNMACSKKWWPCSNTTKSVVAVLISLPYEMLRLVHLTKRVIEDLISESYGTQEHLYFVSSQPWSLSWRCNSYVS